MNPEWNSADPRVSLLTQWEFSHDHARQVFLKDGTHVEILFILAEDGTMQPVPIAAPMTREDVSARLREQLPGSRVYGLIHIAEAWAYLPKGPDDGDTTSAPLWITTAGGSAARDLSWTTAPSTPSRSSKQIGSVRSSVTSRSTRPIRR